MGSVDGVPTLKADRAKRRPEDWRLGRSWTTAGVGDILVDEITDNCSD